MIEGRLFDGRSSDFVSARLRREGERLILSRVADGVPLQEFHFDQARLLERIGDTPRVVEFPGFLRFESSQFAEVEAIFGHRGSFVHRLESNWPLILASVILLLVVAAGAYVYVLPSLARHVALSLPQASVDQIGALGEKALDIEHAESDLEDDDAARLQGAVKRLQDRFPHVRFKVVPMAGGSTYGANAFALPNGTIIFTDELTELLSDPNQILGVLLHEAGHVVQRHTVQLLVQGLAISGFLMVVAGQADWTSAAGALLTLRYSRAHEHEADAFAAAELRAMNLKPSLLASALENLEKSRKDHPERQYGFLLSHPLSEDRIQFLRAQDHLGRPK